MNQLANPFKSIQRDNQQSKEHFIDTLVFIAYFCVFFLITLSLAYKQPFGDAPDEFNRYLIPQYLFAHHTIPNGFDPEIRIPGYGFSYAFQPILPYMFQAFFMQIAYLLTGTSKYLLFAARFANVCFGAVMALFVWKLSKEWFRLPLLQYLFTFLIMFLPQSIFMHTYVNTDSCCMMSIAIILYAITLGLKNGFKIKNCILLAIGIIICALSYYNAYGYIVVSILLFTASFLSKENNHFSFQYRSFLKAASFTAILVLIGISWWFVRSAVLYHGDVLGLRTRDYCASLYAISSLQPQIRETWQHEGYSVFQMLRKSDFIQLSYLSFIGIFGHMSIVSTIWLYRFYRLLFSVLTVSVIVVPDSKNASEGSFIFLQERFHKILFHLSMLFCIVVPCILSIIYSYQTDYQPQGRYLLPALIPFIMYCVIGFQKIWQFATYHEKKPALNTLFQRIFAGISVILLILILLLLFITVFCYVFPFYGNTCFLDASTVI